MPFEKRIEAEYADLHGLGRKEYGSCPGLRLCDK
jgi:hypothetical protein